MSSFTGRQQLRVSLFLTEHSEDEGIRMNKSTRKGCLEDFGDLSELDLLSIAGGQSPWPKAPNWKIHYEKEDKETFRRMIVETGFDGIGRVLDLGCGFGRISMFLGEVNEFVLGVDHNEGGIKIARALAEIFRLDNMRFEVGKADAIPADRESFDGIWMYGVLNYVPRAACLAECHRVLKPGGRLFIGKYNTYGMILRKYLMNYVEDGKEASLTKWATRALSCGPEHDGQPNWATEKTIPRILEKAGFEMVKDPGVVVYPKTCLPAGEAALFENHEALRARLQSDERFVQELIARKDFVMERLAGDLDVVAIKQSRKRSEIEKLQGSGT